MRALAAVLLGFVAGAADASWFGPPCPGLALIPVSDYEVFLKLRRHEADAGEEETLRMLRGGALQMRPDTLHRLGVSASAVRVQPDREGGLWLLLDEVPGLQYRYDSCTQELLLDLSKTRRATNVLFAQADAQLSPQVAQTLGGFLNLDLQAVSGSQPSSSGLVELGAFAGAGHGGISALQREGGWLRLDTSWTIDQPQTLTQWVLGDSISREAPGRRPVRFGGLSWGSEYALQPDIVTFPLPALRGDAVLPSTVDIYVDGVLRQREDVPPGPFELRGVPVTSGSGQMQAVVRDLLGREQVLAQPFYVTPTLLREGLSDYRLEGGWLRQGYGNVSSDYGPVFTAVSYRRGLSDRYTGALQFDADADRQSLGTGLAAQLGGLGSAQVELAASRSGAGGGAQALLGLARQAAAFSASIELRAATTQYAALGDSDGAPRYSVSARAGLPLPRSGSLSATVIAEASRAGHPLRVYALNYSTRLSANWLLGAQLTRTESGDSDWLLGAGLTWLLRGNSSASAYAQHSGDTNLARVGWQQQPPQALGLGYQVDVEHSDADANADRALAQLRWTQQRGVLSAAAEIAGDQTALRYGLQTGLAWLGSNVYSTRPVHGSFAVVEAGGIEGVRIYRDHQLVARTAADGRALVPDLRAYEPNRLNIELADLPIEQRANAEQITVVPYARSGATVRFPVSATAQERWLRLRRADGSWLPSGAKVEVVGGRGAVMVGTEGRVLLSGVSGAVQLEARWSGGRCRTLVRAARASQDDTEPLLCSPQ